ncbi:hypothetical protein H8A97_01980 [Bradyrhizobium sp. Arg62]|uniref:hypothetical protein n=1 Tax=Bradyrhizobium brasilense TaxID=1419277 RepID=UPI001E596E80|nr:hypothetical protein [Bradyrhizobium brasilense]MCC8943901.1 hypothetical protein [Bradyrhizobium brasilense]
MAFALVGMFAICYAAIALEHPLKVNKSSSALLGAGLLWTVYALSTGDHDRLGEELTETIGMTAKIVFFLTGAMTIAEVIGAKPGRQLRRPGEIKYELDERCEYAAVRANFHPGRIRLEGGARRT